MKLNDVLFGEPEYDNEGNVIKRNMGLKNVLVWLFLFYVFQNYSFIRSTKQKGGSGPDSEQGSESDASDGGLSEGADGQSEGAGGLSEGTGETVGAQGEAAQKSQDPPAARKSFGGPVDAFFLLLLFVGSAYLLAYLRDAGFWHYIGLG